MLLLNKLCESRVQAQHGWRVRTLATAERRAIPESFMYKQ
jgi:hypothetical protein